MEAIYLRRLLMTMLSISIIGAQTSSLGVIKIRLKGSKSRAVSRMEESIIQAGQHYDRFDQMWSVVGRKNMIVENVKSPI